ncbi:hypothetical protein FE501_19265 [Clostridioides difficile]|nr:hypothetical protein [Clostridioides difficile]
MKNGLGLLAALSLFAAPVAAWAGQATVVLNVHHAGCVLCGPIVKSTLAHVKGVSGVTVGHRISLADRDAADAFDMGERALDDRPAQHAAGVMDIEDDGGLACPGGHGGGKQAERGQQSKSVLHASLRLASQRAHRKWRAA